MPFLHWDAVICDVLLADTLSARVHEGFSQIHLLGMFSLASVSKTEADNVCAHTMERYTHILLPLP